MSILIVSDYYTIHKVEGAYVFSHAILQRSTQLLVYDCDNLENLKKNIKGAYENIIVVRNRPTHSILCSYITKLQEKYQFEYILLVNSTTNKELGPCLAVRLGGSYIPNAVGFTVKDGSIAFRRPIYGGVAEEIIKPIKRPVITLLNDDFEIPQTIPPPQQLVANNIEEVSITEEDSLMKIVSVERMPVTTDITRAKIVLGVGRGFKDRKDLDMVFELASLIGGEVGGSRPIVQDFKWLEEKRLIGLSGASINADVYIAIGISGQIHHLMGIKNVKTVIAINKDPNSPFKDNADYFIKADLYKLLPKLIEEIRKLKGG